MKIKIILMFLTLPIFSACQTLTDYSIIGISKQNLDKGDSYTLNEQVDFDKSIDSSVNAMRVKESITGEYVVQNQWNRYLSWNVEQVNLKIHNDSLVADLYGKGKLKPFYGVQASNCISANFVASYEDPVWAKRVQSKIKFLTLMSEGRITDLKLCGSFVGYDGVIEYKAVKKGYEQSVFKNSPVDILTKWETFIVPENGYIITIRDKKISGGWQDKGAAEITIFAKKLSNK